VFLVALLLSLIALVFGMLGSRRTIALAHHPRWHRQLDLYRRQPRPIGAVREIGETAIARRSRPACRRPATLPALEGRRALPGHCTPPAYPKKDIKVNYLLATSRHKILRIVIGRPDILRP
jgi:hypothetical protein